MEHLLLKAATTAATDQGTFTAVISAATIDRERDIVEPQAMVDALHKWVAVGKRIPLLWHHSTKPEDNIGHIDPGTAKAVDGEVVVDGFVDQSTPRGAEAWRLVKSGTLGFSFGYLVTEADKRPNGGLHIKGLDVFEITATSTPMNGDTRVLSWKAMSPSMMAERMRAMADEMESDNPPDPADMARRMRAMAGQMADMGKSFDEVEELTYPDGVTTKAVWTTAYINDLPDSAFLYVESGGEKDSEGKTTPRNLRHFPYKDADGNVDMPHLRNALSRIPQSNLSQDIKDRLTRRAQQILDSQKAAVKDARDEDPMAVKSEAQDLLRRRADEVALKHATSVDPHTSPRPVEQPKPELVPLDELKQRMRDHMLRQLSGGLSDEPI